MKKKLAYGIPTDGLVFDMPLDWNAIARVWPNGTATNVTWVNTEIGYQKQCGSFNGSSSRIQWSWLSLWTWNINISIIWWFNFTNKSVQYRTMFNCWTEAVNQAVVFFNKWTAENVVEFSSFWSTWPLFSYNNIIKWKWHFIVWTHDWTTSRIYLDWVLKDSLNKTINFQWWNYSIWARQNNSEFHLWQIQWLRIYNRALSQQEIQNLYQEWLRQLWAWSDNILSSAVAYYDFNWDANDVIGWNNWTVTWATLTTDRFWIANRAYSFNLSSDKINFWWASSLAFNLQDVSYEMIVKPNTVSSLKTLLIKRRGTAYSLYLWMFNNSWVKWHINSYDWTNNPNWNWTTTINSWQTYHLVFQRDSVSNKLRLYVDWNLEIDIADTTVDWNLYSLTWDLELASAYTWWFTNYSWDVQYLICHKKYLSENEVKELYNLSKVRHLYPFKKTLPPNLKEKFSLWLTWDNSWTTLYDATWTWNATLSSWITTKRRQQHKIIPLSNQGITWSSRTIWTALCWELISGKFELQVNPAYITSTWISSTTKELANIVISPTTLSINEIQAYRYSTFIY